MVTVVTGIKFHFHIRFLIMNRYSSILSLILLNYCKSSLFSVVQQNYSLQRRIQDLADRGANPRLSCQPIIPPPTPQPRIRQYIGCT